MAAPDREVPDKVTIKWNTLSVSPVFPETVLVTWRPPRWMLWISPKD